MSNYIPTQAAIDFAGAVKRLTKELIDQGQSRPYAIIAAISGYGATKAALELNSSEKLPNGRRDFAAKDLAISPITAAKYYNGSGLLDPSSLGGE